MTSLLALNALNFFMADVRDGLGPFLGVFLQSRGWSPSEIGFVMTISGLAGVVASAPAGALVDGVTAKRTLIVAAAAAIVASSLVLLAIASFVVTAASQAIGGVAAAVVGPAIAGTTLGLVGQHGFAHQLGRNEAFNHAGNVTAAALAGLLGYAFGFGAVFAVMSAMALLSIAAAGLIDPAHIDHRAARGLADRDEPHASGWSILFTSKPLLVLALTLTFFHLGNAAMLPLLGQSLVAHGAGNGSAFTGATIVVAQLTMVPMALFAARLAEQRGYWTVFLLALLALPVRGLIAGFVDGDYVLLPVQILDGVGAGLLGVAVPGLVARILAGTGHVNAGLGAVMTFQGIGASLSPSLAGVMAQAYGYSSAFLLLAAIALTALLFWIASRSITAEACGDAPAVAETK